MSDDDDELQPISPAAGEALQQLRARAERRRLVTHSPTPETPAEMQRLVQELQVHQIELEMQYEQLLLAQAEAEASRLQYLDLYEFAPVGYCTLDAAGTLRQLNLRTALLLGLPRQQLQGRRLALFVGPRQQTEFADFLARVLAAAEGDVRHTLTLPLVRPDGQPLELRLEATRAHDAFTDQSLARLALLDVTEQQRASRALVESEQRLRQALDAAAMGVVSWDFATDQWQADARAQAIWGLPYAAAPRPADTLATLLHPADRPRLRLLAELPTARTADVDLELRIVEAQRPDRYVSLTGHVLAAEPAHPRGRLLGLVRDRTLHRRTQQELSYKTQLLERILSHLPVLLGRLDREGRYRELVGAGLRRLHLADNELVGRTIFECFPTVDAFSRQLLAGQAVDFVGSTEHNGERLYYQSYGFFDAERDEVVLFALDITEREQQRAELEREQQFAQSVLDHSVDSMITFDADLRVTAWNTQAAAYTGIAAAQAVGRSFAELMPSVAADPRFRALVAAGLAGEAGQLLSWPGLYYHGILNLHLRPFSSPTHPHGVLLVARDVTQREQLLAETTRLKLRQQQLVLSAILTTQEEERRRIAEALHNGVGQLLYATRLHLTQLPDSEPLRAGQQLLQEAIRATRTISFELTPRILEDFGLPTALRELADRIPVSLLGLRLSLEGLEDTVGPVPAPVQMAAYRIVQELLNNVMKHAQARHVVLVVAQHPERLRIRITDDGVGFVPEPVAAGIGLAGIRNRVELLGGTLLIASVLTQGTTITIELPLQVTE